MYGLNAFSLVLFSGINVFAYSLCKFGEQVRNRVVKILCFTLLLGNIIKYTVVYPYVIGKTYIPVEFSTVAYFTVPVSLILNNKKSESWAAYSGILAGFFYYMAMIVFGGQIYSLYPSSDIYISLFCHGILYVCGFVTINTKLHSRKEWYKLLIGILFVATRALVLRPLVINAEGLFIYKLLDGDLIKFFVPQHILGVIMPVYYVFIIVFVLLSIKIFHKINRIQYCKLMLYKKQKSNPCGLLFCRSCDNLVSVAEK